MKVVKWLLGGLAAVVVLILGVSLLLPASYSVERTTTIEAPANVVHDAVIDLRKWQEWEPWGQVDESMVVEFGESTRGAGASYTWTGDLTGEGRIRILNASPQRVEYEFVFNGETKDPSFSEMTLDALDEETTEVTWTFCGDIDHPLNRYFGLLVGPMIEGNYEQGLESLKAFCEAQGSNP